SCRRLRSRASSSLGRKESIDGGGGGGGERSLGPLERDEEGRSVRSGIDPDSPTHRFDQSLRDVQAQSRPTGSTSEPRLDPVEAVEDPVPLVNRYPLSLVSVVHACLVLIRGQG